MTLRPLETRYKGYHFRSRLEARWAVFFDALGVRWQYEPEGYDLDGVGPYLPDFKVWLNPISQEHTWFEIKGTDPTALEIEKARALARQDEKLVLLCCGEIGEPSGMKASHSARKWIWEGTKILGFPAEPYSNDDYETLLWGLNDAPCGEILPTVRYYHPSEFSTKVFAVTYSLGIIQSPHPAWRDMKTGENTLRMCAAYQKARGARFEHGASG